MGWQVFFLIFGLWSTIAFSGCPRLLAARGGMPPRVKLENQGRHIYVEFLTDEMVRFEVSGFAIPDHEPIFTSPMIHRTSYPGPSAIHQTGNRIETPAIAVELNPESLCLNLFDKRRGGSKLTTLCAQWAGTLPNALAIDPAGTKNVYGLGQYLDNPMTADGDWVGRVWEPGAHGNDRRDAAGGAPSYAQVPVMYALGQHQENYALFLDTGSKLRWDFKSHWWRVSTGGLALRGYLMAGKDIRELRKSYMDLVGRPPVPPKKVLGLWVSEFGYTHWGEVDTLLAGLRSNGFPIEGFVMDIQWFGNRFNDAYNSRMGTLTWDEAAFPNAREKIRQLREQGIDLMPIEESYVHHYLPEHAMMADRGYLARNPDGSATFLDANPWWGKGGLIDWTHPGARRHWHDVKRKPLVDMGIRHHWTDLGEPEMYQSSSLYHGTENGQHAHWDIHNLYNLMWARGIAEGYERNGVRDRFFILSRAGAAGIQRYSAGMWTGDVGMNLGSLKMQPQAHMHMSMAGIDYHGSDVGGFFNWSLDGSRDALFTQWFAMSALLDTPLRPHTWNLDKKLHTAPHLVGHVPSNLDNLRLRYELIPYYYSLAHRAHLYGEPVIPPLVYYHQEDPNVRRIGNQMMIGRDLIMGVVAEYGEVQRNVYLPRGRWVNFHTHESFASEGQYLDQVPVYNDGKLKLPLFARAGAIIPKARVTESTRNVFDLKDLVVRVYADEAASSFTLYEDDGLTTRYSTDSEVRRTTLHQKLHGNTAEVTVEATRGIYQNAAQSRDVTVELVTHNRRAVAVKLNGAPVPFENKARNLVVARAGNVPVDRELKFTFELEPIAQTGAVFFSCREGHTQYGEAVFVTGSLPELGNWDVSRAVRLNAAPYPTWTGTVTGLPVGKEFEWKCFKRHEHGGPALQWEDGPNHKGSTGVGQPYATEGKF